MDFPIVYLILPFSMASKRAVIYLEVCNCLTFRSLKMELKIERGPEKAFNESLGVNNLPNMDTSSGSAQFVL